MVLRTNAAISAVGRLNGKVDKPQPLATFDGNSISCEDCVKYIY